jgi:ribokinase
LTPNEHEAAILTGELQPERAGKKLLEAGCRNVVITLGAKGALLINATGVHRVAAPKVKPVDTVGAGDCFTGWLATGIAEELIMEQSVERAARAASIAVTRPGAQDAMPRREEVETKANSAQ